jgi:ATP-dependent DNA ligase
VAAGDGRLHEVKFDGYRVQIHKAGSLNGQDFTERFPSIAQLLHELPAKAAVLDGEVVTSDADTPELRQASRAVDQARQQFSYGGSTCSLSTARTGARSLW